MKLVKMCLKATGSKVLVSKPSSDVFPIQNDVKQGDASLLLLNFALEHAVKKKSGETRID
jgi:hypothetical protein